MQIIRNNKLAQNLNKRLIVLWVFVLVSSVSAAFASVHQYQKKNTATTSNQTVTFTFNPAVWCINNSDASTNLWYDATDGVAAATDNSTNIELEFGSTHCYYNRSNNVLNIPTIGVITASGTATYKIWGYRDE